MISAGRVLLMPKGDYDPTATYEMLDIVSYNGSSYIAKSTTTGNLPTNTTYWQLSAYGGQASNLAGNFAPLETTDYATRAYVADDIFVDKDSQLVIATTTINIGDEIEIGSNCNLTTMAELLDAIENRYDALDQRNRKLIGITQLTAQTDLHLLVPGEYYKKLTNFYVTNAPTGINQIPAAIFRLTVESGLDESGSSLLLTLRTIEGEIYTQAYDGSVWSDWRKAGDVDSSNLGTAAAKDSTNAVTSGSTDLVESGAVYTGLAAKQPKTLDTAITVDGVQQTTVEGALGAINTEVSTKTFEIDDTTETTLASDDIIPFYDTSATAKRKMTVQKFGEQLISNPNLLDNPWFTVNQRGQSTYNLTENGMTADRWAASVSAGTMIVGVSSNGLTITEASDVGDGGLIEGINKPELLGKIVTISIDDGTNIYHATGTIPNIQPVNWTEVCSVITSGGINAALFISPMGVTAFQLQYVIRVPKDNTAYTIRAVKLELGSVSTLAQDTAPNYATELLKCQRYFLRVPNTGSAYASLGCGSTFSATQANIFIATPARMRAIPSVVLNGNFFMRGGGAVYNVSAANVYNYAANGVTLELTSSGMTASYAVELCTNNDTTAYLDFSADL